MEKRKLKKLMVVDIARTLNYLLSLKMNPEDKYEIHKFGRVFLEEADLIEIYRVEIVKKYLDEDETEISDPKKKAQAEREVQEFYKTEVEVECGTFNLKWLGKHEVETITPLFQFIEEPKPKQTHSPKK